MMRLPGGRHVSIAVAVLLLFVCCAHPVMAAAADAPKERFGDLAGHWASAAIDAAATNGYVAGYPDGTFRPDTSVTRAEALTMIVRSLTAAHRMTPVPAESAWVPNPLASDSQQHWVVQQAILPTAAATGLLLPQDCDENGRFRPDRPITRLEVAKWLARAVNPALEDYIRIGKNRAAGGWPAAAQQSAALPAMLQAWPFRDAVPTEVEVYVKVLHAAKVVQGFPDQRFGGDEPLTRAELVTMLQRIGPVAALKPGATIGEPPTDAIHGRVAEVRIAVRPEVVQRLGFAARPLRGDRPSDWPAIDRLLTALSSAREDTAPESVPYDFPPPSSSLMVPTPLQIEFADGHVVSILPLQRCQYMTGGSIACGDEPGWVQANGRNLHSVALWETVSGQLRFDMPLLRT